MPNGRAKFGLLLVVSLATLGLAGCATTDEPSPTSNPPAAASPPPSVASPSTPTASSTTTTQSSPTPSSSGDVKQFDVDLNENGFNGQKDLTLHVKLGDNVRIVFRHAEPYGDDHPIYFTCTGRAATVTATGGPVAMDIVADEVGTCRFFCTNGDCGPHESFQGGKLVVEA